MLIILKKIENILRLIRVKKTYSKRVSKSKGNVALEGTYKTFIYKVITGIEKIKIRGSKVDYWIKLQTNEYMKRGTRKMNKFWGSLIFHIKTYW